MIDPEDGEVPDGAAVFPEIPEELGVNPLLLAAVHAVVFLAGSEENIVQPDAADEAVEQMADYFQRLEGASLARVKEDLACLADYGRQQQWPRPMVQALKTFLADLGVEKEEED